MSRKLKAGIAVLIGLTILGGFRTALHPFRTP